METHQDSFHQTLFNTTLDCGHYLPDMAKSLKIDEIKSHISFHDRFSCDVV